MKVITKREVFRLTNEMQTAQALFKCLLEENVDLLFGYPGGAVLHIYDALYKEGIRHILARHEQGAIHMAEGYARVSGKPGVVIATSGPGATNLVTGLADANMDSLPLVVITGQVNTTAIGTDAFQEADIIGITNPITKHNYQVRRGEDLPRIIKEAFHIATHGRPGPVLIDIPKNISAALIPYAPAAAPDLPGFQPPFTPDGGDMNRLISMLKKAARPLILAGAGVIHAGAHRELLEFVDRVQIPVTNTLLGLGGFPSDHPLFLGMCGMHGTYTANMAIQHADLLISIGARFDDRVTGRTRDFAPMAKIVHIDIDASEIAKNVPTDLPIVGDAREALKVLLSARLKPIGTPNWIEQLNQWKRDYPLWYTEDGSLKPQQVIEEMYRITGGKAVVTTDVGQHQMWVAQYFGFNQPRRLVTSGGLGTMGFGFPAALGAALSEPGVPVLSVVGDGGFQMNIQELATAAEENIPVTTIVLNNASLGMVRQWQDILYEKRYSHSLLTKNPDFARVSESFGVKGYRVTTLEEFSHALQEALSLGKPAVLDVHVTPHEHVYPMVCTGSALDEMIGIQPPTEESAEGQKI